MMSNVVFLGLVGKTQRVTGDYLLAQISFTSITL